MLKNESGKILTVFLVIFAILLVSLSAISMFFFQKELERRKVAESELDRFEMTNTKLETELKEANKRLFVLEEKNKEADEKINSLMEDLELEQGLREEMRIENQKLKTSAERFDQERDRIRKDLMAQIESLKNKNAETEVQLSEERKRIEELQKNMMSDLSEEKSAMDMEDDAPVFETAVEPPPVRRFTSVDDGMVRSDVELEKIIIPSGIVEDTGKILTIDADNNFVIFDLGQNDGVNEGDVMAVYRKQRRLGEVKVTRVQPGMSAADFVPPLSGKKVRKSDQILNSK